jgi:hypothetical protein
MQPTGGAEDGRDLWELPARTDPKRRAEAPPVALFDARKDRAGLRCVVGPDDRHLATPPDGQYERVDLGIDPIRPMSAATFCSPRRTSTGAARTRAKRCGCGHRRFSGALLRR